MCGRCGSRRRRGPAQTGDVIRFQLDARDRDERASSRVSRRRGASRPGNGVIDDDGAFVGYEAGHVHRVSRTSASARPGDRARWPRATCDARPRSSVACRARVHAPRKSGSTRTASNLYLGTGARRRSHVRDRHQQSGEARRHRFDHREHAPRERHHDDARRQVHGVHARRRGRPQERHRHRVARRSGASRRRSPSSPTA